MGKLPTEPGWYYARVAGEGVRPVQVTLLAGALVAWPHHDNGWFPLDDADVQWLGSIPRPPGVERWG